MTQLSALDSSQECWDEIFRKRQKPKKKNSKALILGGLLWPFSSSTVQKASPFLCHSKIFKAEPRQLSGKRAQSHTRSARRECWKRQTTPGNVQKRGSEGIQLASSVLVSLRVGISAV